MPRSTTDCAQPNHRGVWRCSPKPKFSWETKYNAGGAKRWRDAWRGGSKSSGGERRRGNGVGVTEGVVVLQSGDGPPATGISVSVGTGNPATTAPEHLDCGSFSDEDPGRASLSLSAHVVMSFMAVGPIRNENQQQDLLI